MRNKIENNKRNTSKSTRSMDFALCAMVLDYPPFEIRMIQEERAKTKVKAPEHLNFHILG
ncbi:MAG: hypothetical protein J0H68_06925 [Sphingobacteriia bacterium]|nr:hypothetical protein [Sphingobacteriia bacterium]